MGSDQYEPHGALSIRRQSERHTEALIGVRFDDVQTPDGDPMPRHMARAIEQLLAA